MNNLLIIGNGFDLAHNILSSYEQFRQYLIALLSNITGGKYDSYDFSDNSIITSEYSDTPESEILTIIYFLSNAEYQLDMDYKETFELSRKDIPWKEVEKSVGELSYDDFYDLYIDESENDKEQGANVINEDIFAPYVKVLCKIPNYFAKWIRQLDIDDAKRYKIKDFENMFDNNSKFLCFNYTDTLEAVYNISRENICYIHGKVKESDSIFFGHGNKLEYEDFLQEIDNPNYISVAEGYTSINESLRKPVEDIIKCNNEFFGQLSKIEEVVSYGFSFGEVDEPYIKEIIKSLSDSVTWKVVSTESKMEGSTLPSVEKRKEIEKTLKKCGFKGIVNNITVET